MLPISVVPLVGACRASLKVITPLALLFALVTVHPVTVVQLVDPGVKEQVFQAPSVVPLESIKVPKTVPLVVLLVLTSMVIGVEPKLEKSEGIGICTTTS